MLPKQCEMLYISFRQNGKEKLVFGRMYHTCISSVIGINFAHCHLFTVMHTTHPTLHTSGVVPATLIWTRGLSVRDVSRRFLWS